MASWKSTLRSSLQLCHKFDYGEADDDDNGSLMTVEILFYALQVCSDARTVDLWNEFPCFILKLS